MRLALLAHFLLDLRVNLTRGLFVSVDGCLLLLCAGRFEVRIIWRSDGLHRRFSRVVLCGALFVGASLRVTILLLAFRAALLSFYNVVTQLAIVAEQPPVGYDKLGSLLFFCHRFC